MSDKPNDTDSSGKPAADPAPSEPTLAEHNAPASAENPQQAGADGDPAARIDELEGQIADLTDRLLRAHAEMDNVRKRADREKADMARYAITRFATDIVALTDNFQRARQSVPNGAADENPMLKGFLDGVIQTERAFLSTLEKHGVRPIEAAGRIFNPHQHEAVMQVPNPDVPSGTIISVLQAGYMIEDRVLRPAMVAVAQGGPKPEKHASDATAAATPTPRSEADGSERPESTGPA